MNDRRITSAISNLVSSLVDATHEALEAQVTTKLQPPSQSPSEPHQTPTMMTKRELAGRLSVSTRTIDNLIKHRSIPYYRIGKAIRFNPLQVIDHLNQNQLVKPRPTLR